MAPESRLWRHQLGESTTGLRRGLLKAALPICLMISVTVTHAEAKTEPADSWSRNASTFLFFERSSVKGLPAAASLSPVPDVTDSPSVGRWSNRIQIPIPNQPSIQNYIRFYHGQGRTTFLAALERSWPYVPTMSKIFETYGVPPEMLAVALIESCFRRNASCRGAGGYWQMLAATARKMGLRVDRWVDERMDPVKSTEAAARYLRSFYDQFHSWDLALAAYNAGGGTVMRAVQNSGAGDFWELSSRRQLPRRTRDYVPKVLAAVKVMQDLENYRAERSRHIRDFDCESISVKASLDLRQVARWIDVPVEDLRDLNPSLRLDRLPPDEGGRLNLPSGTRDKFSLAYEEYVRK